MKIWPGMLLMTRWKRLQHLDMISISPEVGEKASSVEINKLLGKEEHDMDRARHVCQNDTHTKKRNSRFLVLTLTVVLAVGSVVSGTVAWLIAGTDPVVNTFTYGDINLKLEETKVDEKGNPVDLDNDGNLDKTITGNEYEMVPGEEYLKDPAVTVLEGNEACWLFVKLEEKGGVTITNGDGSTKSYNFDDYLTYSVADGWNQLLDENGAPVEGIYFRQVGEDTDDTAVSYEILKDNKISVLGTVTKEMLNALDNNGQDTANADYPSLSVTAYAVQYSGFEAEISEGAAESTSEQNNAAALSAWEAMETQNASTNP